MTSRARRSRAPIPGCDRRLRRDRGRRIGPVPAMPRQGAVQRAVGVVGVLGAVAGAGQDWCSNWQRRRRRSPRFLGLLLVPHMARERDPQRSQRSSQSHLKLSCSALASGTCWRLKSSKKKDFCNSPSSPHFHPKYFQIRGAAARPPGRRAAARPWRWPGRSACPRLSKRNSRNSVNSPKLSTVSSVSVSPGAPGGGEDHLLDAGLYGGGPASAAPQCASCHVYMCCFLVVLSSGVFGFSAPG